MLIFTAFVIALGSKTTLFGELVWFVFGCLKSGRTCGHAVGALGRRMHCCHLRNSRSSLTGVRSALNDFMDDFSSSRRHFPDFGALSFGALLGRKACLSRQFSTRRMSKLTRRVLTIDSRPTVFDSPTRLGLSGRFWSTKGHHGERRATKMTQYFAPRSSKCWRGQVGLRRFMRLYGVGILVE